MSKQITRQQFITEINRRLPDEYPTGNSFGDRGMRMKFNRAVALRRALESGSMPTVNQVVGYFGAGARFVGDNDAR